AQSPYLQDIRDYLVAEILEVAPEWLDKPKGFLGEFWNKDELNAACNILWITIMLRLLSLKADQDSLSRLRLKFKALLYASEPKFSEYRAEFEVGAYLTEHMDSLIIEPLDMRDGNANLAHQVKSPDYAFDSEDRVYLEVTYFNVGTLDKWQ